jgi:hypothetical protein
MKSLLITVSVLAFLTLSVGNALACSCAEQAPCQAYDAASAVFIGTVIDSRHIKVTQDNYERDRMAVRLSVDSAFRGVTGSEVELTTGLGGGDCGFGFVKGQQYLVYASERRGKLSTGICSRTRDISRAAVDLNYIRGLAKAKPGATIIGKVIRRQPKENGGYENLPLAGVKIIINGEPMRELESDVNGQFRIEGLPAGSYEVKVLAPKELQVAGTTEQKVTVTERGCAIVNFWLEPIAGAAGNQASVSDCNTQHNFRVGVGSSSTN